MDEMNQIWVLIRAWPFKGVILTEVVSSSKSPTRLRRMERLLCKNMTEEEAKQYRIEECELETIGNYYAEKMFDDDNAVEKVEEALKKNKNVYGRKSAHRNRS